MDWLVQKAWAFDPNSIFRPEPLTGTLGAVIARVMNYMLWIAGIIAVFYLVYAGIQYVMASGDSTKAGQAKTGIVNAIIGIVVILLAIVIVNTVVGVLSGTNTPPPPGGGGGGGGGGGPIATVLNASLSSIEVINGEEITIQYSASGEEAKVILFFATKANVLPGSNADEIVAKYNSMPNEYIESEFMVKCEKQCTSSTTITIDVVESKAPCQVDVTAVLLKRFAATITKDDILQILPQTISVEKKTV